MTGFLGAVQFLTRVPIRLVRPVPHARVLPWFPAVGSIIGAILGLVAVGMAQLVPTGPAAALAVVTGLLITGAFHEDGLADVADAFGGGWTNEQRFEILKDSRHGTYGVAALASSIVVRVACAASIASSAALFAGFLVAHTMSRAAAVAVLTVVRPAAESGLGADSSRDANGSTAWAGIVVGLAASTITVGWWVGPIFTAALAGSAAVAWLAIRKIGGIAGDVLGAIQQVVECIVLLVVSGLAVRHQVWWT